MERQALLNHARLAKVSIRIIVLFYTSARQWICDVQRIVGQIGLFKRVENLLDLIEELFLAMRSYSEGGSCP